jgi:hypothetical protein
VAAKDEKLIRKKILIELSDVEINQLNSLKLLVYTSIYVLLGSVPSQFAM